MDANAPGEGQTTSPTPAATAATAATTANGVNDVNMSQEGPKRVTDISDDDLLKGRTKFRTTPY